MQWFIKVIKNFSFRGRARRKEYWMFTLFVVVIAIVLEFADTALGTYLGSPDLGLLTLSFFVLIAVQAIAVSVRRLHDTGRTAWWLLIQFVPYLGTIVWLVFAILPGQDGENRFGPDPKQVN
jgi:uncharacterized membrane protein YhaH (DUF805 family)